MALKLGSTDVNKIYLGSSEVSRIYLGSNLVFGTEGQQSQPWLLTRQSWGETELEYNITSENLPIEIAGNGITYFQITKLSEDGSNAEILDVSQNKSINISTTSAYTPTDKDNYAAWIFEMPQKYQIIINCKQK